MRHAVAILPVVGVAIVLIAAAGLAVRFMGFLAKAGRSGPSVPLRSPARGPGNPG